MTRLHSWSSRLLSWRHPDIESLLLWAEGESYTRVERHLARCEDCREHAVLLHNSIQLSPRDEVSNVLLDNLFETLRLRMQAIRHGRDNVAAAVEHYFGKQAVRRLASSAQRNSSEVRLMSTAEPLFNAFLGRKAADALTSRLASVA